LARYSIGPAIIGAVNRHGGVLACLLLIAGCVADPAASNAPGRSLPVSGSPAPSAGPSASPAPSASLDEVGPIEAAKLLLGAERVSVRMTVVRAKGEQPAEVLLHGDGALDPAGGRGRMRYDLSGLLAVPGASPDPLDVVEVAWNDGRFWALSIDEDAGGWQVMERQDATDNGGLIGRLPNEALGLVVLVADAERGSIEPLPPEPLGDGVAARSMVSVPLVDSADRGVPADAPNADAIQRAYGVDAVELEVWIVDGGLRRIRYAFAREKALYGGPDLTTVTYDYVADPTLELIVPPDDAPP
jgi:hypothetical protein